VAETCEGVRATEDGSDSLSAISKIFGRRRGAAAALAIAATALVGSLAPAQETPPPQDESSSPLHSLAKGLGFATDVEPPPEFVQQSRPAGPQAEIPVFTPPDEPPGKPKSAKEIEAIGGDLESIAKRHDALTASFPPAAKAKAIAAAAAEKKAKSKRKPPAAGPSPL
jgi:hypothetical protein